MTRAPSTNITVPKRHRIASLLALTKPRIVELLLVTTLPPMVLAASGWPGTALALATLLGGALSAAGANALNCYLDRRLDRLMPRTAQRPLPVGEVGPGEALTLGVSLGGLGFAVLAVTTNLLAATLATAALGYYVLIYTRWLKPVTDQNIVIGGAAGAFPALVGWAAVTGSLAMPSWVLFLVIFYWTPTHFWALALRYRTQYGRASIPMLPVTRGVRVTTLNMLAYSLLTVVTSLLLVPVAGLGPTYLIAAVGLGLWFIAETWKTHIDPARAMALFTRSTYYLALLFGFVAADVFVSV